MKHTQSAGAIVLNTKGEVLLVHENDNFWGFPKGHPEGNETLETAALREIMEETGLSDVILGKKLGSYKRHPYLLDGTPDMMTMKQITIFLATTTQREFSPTEPAVIPHWVAKKEVADRLTHPDDRAFFASIVHEI